MKSQDVNENNIQGGNKPRDWNCGLDIDFKDDVEILAPKKPKLKKENIDHFKIKTSANDISIIGAEKNIKNTRICKVDKITIRGVKQKPIKDINEEYIHSTTIEETKGLSKDKKLSKNTSFENKREYDNGKRYKNISKEVIADKSYKKREEIEKVIYKSTRRDEVSEISSHISKIVFVDMKKEDKNKNLIKPKRRYDVTDDLSENVSRFSKKVISETKKEREQNKNISKSKRRDIESERSEGLSNISTKVITETKQGKSNKENVYKKISPIKTKGKDEESVFSIISRISKKLSDKNKKTYTVKSKRVTERSDYFSENVNPFSNEISVQTKKGKEFQHLPISQQKYYLKQKKEKKKLVKDQEVTQIYMK